MKSKNLIHTLIDDGVAFAMVFSAIMFALALSSAGCSSLGPTPDIGFEIHIGPGKPPTFSQAQAKRADIEDEVLINGSLVNPSDYPGVIRIFMTGASCSAAVIGKRTILTAAHCANTGDTATFQTMSGKKYSAVMTQGTGYPTKDLDLNLGLTSEDIDVAPMNVKLDRFERVGTDISLIGYGCIQPGGGGGNDGTLRIGQTKVSGAQGYDLILTTPNGAALCYGDSGGPVLWKDPTSGSVFVVGVNSKGNIADTSYTTRLTLDEANTFMKAWDQPICGIAANCTSSTPVPPTPPTPPAPPSKTFNFSNGTVTIQGTCQ